MHPLAAALRFVVHHIAQHGDGPSSQQAQYHLAQIDQYEAQSAPPAPTADTLRPLVDEIVKDLSQAAAQGAVQGVKKAL